MEILVILAHTNKKVLTTLLPKSFVLELPMNLKKGIVVRV